MKNEKVKKSQVFEPKQLMKKIEMSNEEIEELLSQSFDERFDYLVKNGEIEKQSHEGKKILVKLQQIPNTLIFYRKDSLRIESFRM